MRKIRNLPIPANSYTALGVAVRYIRLAASSAEIRIVSENTWDENSLSEGEALKFDEPVSFFLYNDTASDITVDIEISGGDSEKVSATISGAVTITQGGTLAANSTQAIVAAAAAASFLVASSTRKMFHVKNIGANSCFIGPSNVSAANGAIELLAGEEWRESDIASAQWYCFSTAGTTIAIMEGE